MTKTNDAAISGIGTMTVNGNLDRFQVTLQPDTIAHAETATIIVQGKDNANNDVSVPDETPLNFMLDVKGELLGNFFAPNGSQAKSFVGIAYGDASAGNVKYIANGQSPDSAHQISVMVTKGDDAAKNGTGMAVVKQFLDHFAITAVPDTLARTAKRDISTIIVQAKDKNDQDITIPNDTRLDFALDSNGELLGNLLAPNGSQAKSLTDISYGDARAGKVKYLANGDLPDLVSQVKITVSQSNDAKMKGTGTVIVQCHLLPTRYAQNGGDWGDDTYDCTNGTIAALGCALSSAAYVMTVFGDAINPGELNTWMNEQEPNKGGYIGSAVNWSAMEEHSPGKMTIAYTRKQMRTRRGQIDSTQITMPTALDEALTECKLVIVQVYNGDTSNQHWVVVAGKEGERYAIVDPGRNEKYLDSYGVFWSYLVVTKL